MLSVLGKLGAARKSKTHKSSLSHAPLILTMKVHGSSDTLAEASERSHN